MKVEEYQVDEFVSKLHRPLFVLQMARTFEHEKTPMGKSARKRAANARREISQLINDYGSGEF